MIPVGQGQLVMNCSYSYFWVTVYLGEIFILCYRETKPLNCGMPEFLPSSKFIRKSSFFLDLAFASSDVLGKNPVFQKHKEHYWLECFNSKYVKKRLCCVVFQEGLLMILILETNNPALFCRRLWQELALTN